MSEFPRDLLPDVSEEQLDRLLAWASVEAVDELLGDPEETIAAIDTLLAEMLKPKNDR